MTISFRPMTRDDLPLVHEWHQRSHVVRWWTVRETFEETEAHYLPTIDGTDPTQHYLALLDGEPLGMVQTYLVSDYPDYAALIEEGEGTAGLDLFIGDEVQTGKGFGTEMIRGFVDEIVFARPETTACAADPDVREHGLAAGLREGGLQGCP